MEITTDWHITMVIICHYMASCVGHMTADALWDMKCTLGYVARIDMLGYAFCNTAI